MALSTVEKASHTPCLFPGLVVKDGWSFMFQRTRSGPIGDFFYRNPHTDLWDNSHPGCEDPTEKLNLRQSNYFSIFGVNGAKRFRSVVEAMNVIHISKEDQDSVFAMLVVVLWLGNISFTVADNENHVEVVPDKVARYLGVTISTTKRSDKWREALFFN